MSHTVDFKQKLWAEIEQLSPDEAERIYKLVILVKNEFIRTTDDERYETEGWQLAERVATEAYQKGGLKAYAGVDEMVDDILADADE